jgi:DNA modification methylase
VKPYYDHGSHIIYHCDCRDVLADIEPFDLLLTDPAYGLGAARKKFGGHGVKRHMTGLVAGKAIPKRDYGDSEWDDEVCPQDLLDGWIAKSTKQIIWGGNYFKLPPTKCLLVWDKLRGDTDYADGEVAWTNLDKALRIFRYRWNGFLVDATSTDDRIHPTQKPLALMKWCLGLTKDVRTVVDPFAGSFTTAVACKAFGISSISCELDERYCEEGAKRLEQGVLDFGESDDAPGETSPLLFE